MAVVSKSLQEAIQVKVERSSPAERKQMRTESEEILARASNLARMGQLREFESEAMYAVEVLTRLDGLREGKGFFFRGKRRIQYVREYLMQRV